MNDEAALAELLETLEAVAANRNYNAIEYFEPYPKQLLHFRNGLTKRERMLSAGNQQGKTYAGGAEATYHLTGNYPHWWPGRKFKKPVRMWCAGISSTLVRDGPQRILFGKPGVADALGTGLVPKSAIIDVSSQRGTADAIDTAQVRHISGDVSTISFKSYEQGRQKFQSDTIDFGWADEEPPMDIWSELKARITATKGMLALTFTPLMGRSEVVKQFYEEESEDRALVIMTIMDAKHIAPEERAKIIAGYARHERDARVNGVPMMGAGLIFPYDDAMIAEPRIEDIPAHWLKLWSIDFGITHPFAAVLMLYDVEADVAHLHHAIKMTDAQPMAHAIGMKAMGAGVPVAWPHDGSERERSSGETLAASYKQQGLLMLPTHATWPDGGMSTEAGILEMQTRMEEGRLKVGSHLSAFWEEKRLYHRKLDSKTGLSIIVKKDDDILSATRINLMMKRHARAVPLGGRAPRRVQNAIARDVDFELG